ncbi:MAG: pseudouridine synthase [Clostridiales bacterium]|jgi:23S rRNA pseudouridine2605 synthase|nr:rRNA pseudouridine synthase [Eubacteriales bacterium]MDH7565371.1 pseudouridine synthase [Clostridiales bacterium]
MRDMRLQKYLALSGIASRRKAEELITGGRVAVNGIIVRELGTRVSEGDEVLLDGKQVKPEERKLYIALNKPAGYVTTVKDQFGRPAVLDLVHGIKERIYPVGRLDYDTSGLLILTNDGEFTYKLTHPRHEVKKTYTAEIAGIPNDEEICRFEEGLRIEENFVTSPAVFKVKEKKEKSCVVEIVIHEGRNRQVRKMCEAIGHPVISLKRVAIGKLRLGALKEGEWRHLSKEEIEWLMEES